MAYSAKQFSFLLLLTLLSSLHVHARNNQFFSKITTTNAKEIEVPNKEEPLSKQEQEPNFIPQNHNGGYGIYSQESGRLTPTSTASTGGGASYTTSENLPYNYNKEAYVTEPQGMSDTRFMEKGYTTPIHNYRYNNDGNMYNPQEQGMGETKFMERGYTTTNGGNMYNPQKQGMGETKFTERGYTNMYNNEKQGMSDTRFLENGRYFYDLNSENYNINANEGVNSRYGYNKRGRYVNNKNSMEGYENQEEYHERQDEYIP